MEHFVFSLLELLRRFALHLLKVLTSLALQLLQIGLHCIHIHMGSIKVFLLMGDKTTLKYNALESLEDSIKCDIME